MDIEAMNRSLANDYGPARGPNADSTHLLHLWVGDFRLDGVEVVGGSYAPVQIDAGDWAAPDGGGISTGVALTYPVPSVGWGVITHWRLSGLNDGLWWDGGRFSAPLDVTAPGGTLTLDVGAVTVFYADRLLAPAL
jgi:hypothetical protein